jgi:CRP/FNR family transcriptional regulator, cyclic AMP receptor protein
LKDLTPPSDGIVIARPVDRQLAERISMLGNAVLTSPAPMAPAFETSELSVEIRAALVSLGVRGRRTRLSKGSMVSLQQGAQAGLHLLTDGRMKTLRFSEEGRVIILELLAAGDVFGEMSLVGGDGNEATYAEALEEVEFETFPRFAIDRALRGRPGLGLSIARLIGERRNRLERRLETHVFWRVPARLAQLLIDLAGRFGKPAANGTELDIPLNQQDLGNLIGASREIVSLTLSEFRRRGAISTVGRRMAVNEARLRREIQAKEN